MTVFGGVALLLAAIGIYGLVAYSVQQRAREIGIRVGLRAQRTRILSMAARQGMWLVSVGTVTGLGAAFLLAMSWRHFFLVSKREIRLIFLGVPSILALVAASAVAIPAFRASRVSPLNALRYD